MMRRSGAALALLALCAVAHADIRLPDIGNADASLSALKSTLTPQFLQALYQNARLVHEPTVEYTIDRLGKRLVAGSGDTNNNYRFFVIDDDTVNAFAGPGGVIGINTGLIYLADENGELAAVLAHEIAHAAQEHVLRQINDGKRRGALLLAGVLGGLLIGNDAGSALAHGSIAGAATAQLQFSREFERQADRVGMTILDNGGFAPEAMANFFSRLAQDSAFSDSGGVPDYLRTHPVTADRIAESQAQARAMHADHHASDTSDNGATSNTGDDALSLLQAFSYHNTPPRRTNASVLTDTAQQLLQLLKALASNDFATVDTLLATLGENSVDSRMLAVVRARADAAQGKDGDAILARLTAIYPSYYPAHYWRAALALKTADNADAERILSRLYTQLRQQDYTSGYMLMNDEATRRQLRHWYHIARAELGRLRGDSEAARKEYAAALDATGNNDSLNAIIAARRETMTDNR